MRADALHPFVEALAPHQVRWPCEPSVSLATPFTWMLMSGMLLYGEGTKSGIESSSSTLNTEANCSLRMFAFFQRRSVSDHHGHVEGQRCCHPSSGI